MSASQSGAIRFPCDVSPRFVVDRIVVLFVLFIYGMIFEGAMVGIVSGLLSMTMFTFI
jgi:hypothetical protein